jgi:hypothetical protein
LDYDFQNSIDILAVALKDFYHSPFVLVVKILIGIYLAVVLADIILLLILRDVPGHFRTGMKGMDIPTVSKSKMQKRWDKVKSRIESGDVSQFKVAIIEADAIADEMLAGIGYKGGNMTEKLEQVQSAHLDDHLEALKGAHEIRNKIIHEPNYVVDKRYAEAIIGVYENFLRYLELLD